MPPTPPFNERPTFAADATRPAWRTIRPSGTQLNSIIDRCAFEEFHEPLMIGPFWAQARIGRGAQGSVYLATGDMLGQFKPVVVKTFDRDFWDSEVELVERIKRSVRTQSTLAPYGVPDVLLFDPSGTPPWVAQSFAGVGLDRIIDGRPLPRASANRTATGIRRAIDNAHHQQVVHRDLKPANILVDPMRLNTPVQICDFDLARSSSDTTLTATGMAMGNRAYSAPEQLLGERGSLASDVYAYAGILVTLATGKLPSAVVRDLLRPGAIPGLPDAVREVFGNEVAGWVERALQFDPLDRPSIGDDALTEALRAGSGPQTGARPELMSLVVARLQGRPDPKPIQGPRTK